MLMHCSVSPGPPVLSRERDDYLMAGAGAGAGVDVDVCIVYS